MPTASNVAFVADSTLGLSPKEALGQGIHVVPQQVIWKDKTFRDQLDITDEEVLELLRQGERLSTSQVAPEDLRTTYKTLLQNHERVLSVHVSGHLSGTVATAMAVAREFGERVKVLDSWSLNGGLLLLLEEARRLLGKGVAWERLEETLAPYRERLRGYVPPPDPHLPAPLRGKPPDAFPACKGPADPAGPVGKGRPGLPGPPGAGVQGRAWQGDRAFPPGLSRGRAYLPGPCGQPRRGQSLGRGPEGGRGGGLGYVKGGGGGERPRRPWHRGPLRRAQTLRG